MSDTRELTIREAIREALAEELSRDLTVFMIGEDIGRAGGVYGVTSGLWEEFGPQRIMDSPITEAGVVGISVGAAMTGLRPVVEIMFCDILTLAMDQIVNQASKLRYMTGGQARIPLVVRTAMGAGRGVGAQHSQSLHVWMAHVPGLKVVIPSTPYDAKGLLKSAIRDDNPVIFFEDKLSYGDKGPVPEGDYTIPLGVADIKRAGDDLTIVATSSMVQVALGAADILEQEGLSVEVVDPRCLQPWDKETIIESVKKTGRVIVVDEGYRSYGITGEIAATIADEAFDYLDAPVKRIGAVDVPVPMSPALEELTIPNEKQVVEIARELRGHVI